MNTPTPPNFDLTSPLTPSHRTLLLKHGRSTVLLAALSSTPLLTVKRGLLAALASRGITTFPSTGTGTTGLPLPTDPAALELGVLVDRKDASRGWRLLREDEPSSSSSSTNKAGRGGGKGVAQTRTGTVDAAGLVDGAWLAYRLSRRQRRRQHDKQEVIEKGKEEEEEEKEEEKEAEEMEQDMDEEMDDDPGWNVVIATFEEADAAAAAREAEQDEEDEGEENIINNNNIPIPIPSIR